MAKFDAVLKKSLADQDEEALEAQPFDTPISDPVLPEEEATQISTNGAYDTGISAGATGRAAPLTREQLKLRSAVLQAQEARGLRSVVVTGISEESGVTSVATALARGMSWDQNKNVLLIDMNFSRPKLDRVFGLPHDEGMVSRLAHGGNLLDAAVAVEPSNLMVLPMGYGGRSAGFDAKKFVAAIPSFHDNFDFVVVDAPPISRYPDVLMVGAYFDSVALVVEAERTRLPELQVMVDELARSRVKLLGVVLNRERNDLPNWLQSLL